MELQTMRVEVLQILVESQDVDELLGSLDVLLSEVRAGWQASPEERREIALSLAAHRPITSSELAEAAQVSQEAARLTLVALVESGEMERVGEKRGTQYRMPAAQRLAWSV